ncbi:MAG: pilus assembly protein PilM [Candidatus Omnitrophota bacterium]|nr:pilus assembly protein PilM [Candidatus Omnitrophota bacterium]
MSQCTTMNISAKIKKLKLFTRHIEKVLVVDTSAAFSVGVEQSPEFTEGQSSELTEGRSRSIDISSNLKLLNIEFKEGIKLTALNIIKLSKENREEEIINSIRSFIKENNIRHKEVVLSPALGSLIIKRIQLPVLPEKELLEAIKWRLKDDVPFDLSGAVVKYQIIKKESKEDGAKTHDIICVIAKEEEIKQQVLLLKQIGLKCLRVGVSAFGYAKAIEECVKEAQNEAVGVLHLWEEGAYFSIYNENKLTFYREIPVSINKLKESLTQVLSSVKGKTQLTSEEIDEFLFGEDALPDALIYKDKIAVSRILEMLRPNLERLAQEIKRSLAYYETQFKEGAVKKFFFSGEAVRIANLSKILSNELPLVISAVPLQERFTFSPSLKTDFLLRSCAAFGLGMADNEINLLPQEFRTEKIEKFQRVSLRWMAFLAFLLLFVPYIFTKAGLGMYQRRLDNTLLHLNTLSEIKKIKQDADALSNFSQIIRNSGFFAGALLERFSKIVPQNMFFKEFSLDCESKTGSIIGFLKDSSSSAILAEFTGKMNNSGYALNTKVDSVDKVDSDGRSIDNFKLSFQIP